MLASASTMKASLPQNSSWLFLSALAAVMRSAHAARQRDGCDPRIGDDAGDRLVAGIHVGEQALGEAGGLIGLFKRISRAHHVGCVLENNAVAREHVRPRGAHHRPDRQV